MDDPRHIVGVSGLFFNRDGSVLLVKTERRDWECPGGQVELGEDLITALIRETREESGCEVAIVCHWCSSLRRVIRCTLSPQCWAAMSTRSSTQYATQLARSTSVLFLTGPHSLTQPNSRWWL